MTNTQLSAYIGQQPAQTRKLFDVIRQAFEDAGLGDVTREVADLYLHGQEPSNYKYYLDRLNAVKFLSEHFKPQRAETIIKSNFYDPWVMLLATAQHFIGEAITPEFETLIVSASNDNIKLVSAKEQEKLQAIYKARKTIETIGSPLKKVLKELESIEEWKLAGTPEEYITIKIRLVLERIERIA